jgi:hypothetical protein
LFRYRQTPGTKPVRQDNTEKFLPQSVEKKSFTLSSVLSEGGFPPRPLLRNRVVPKSHTHSHFPCNFRKETPLTELFRRGFGAKGKTFPHENRVQNAT